MRRKKFVLIALSLLTISTTALSASYPCAKTTTAIEKQICADSLLNKLDEALSINYKGMQDSNFGGSHKALKAEQNRWIASRNQCKTKQCLVSMYRKRIDETCDYGVISGLHPICQMSDEIK